MRRSPLAALALFAALAGVAFARPALPNKEFNDLKKDAQNAAKVGDASAVAGKLRDMARDESERAVETIGDIAVRVPSMDVYEAARDAIAGMQSEEAYMAILEKCEKERNPMIKILIIDAVAQRTDERSEEALGKALADKTDEVLRAACQAAKKRKAKRAVDGLIALVERLEGKQQDVDSLLMTQAREALLAITGQQFDKAQDYRNYWEPRKADFRVPTGGEQKELQGTSERKKPKFFGTEVRSNRVVFVIDTSGSMEAADPAPTTGGDVGPAGGSRVRMERAKQQLTAVVEGLDEGTRFTIISYSGVMFQGPNGGGQLPPNTPEDGPLPPMLGGIEWLKTFKPRLMQANKQTKAEAKAWIAELKANGSTFTFNALAAAFQVEGADTIMLLSDGVPTEFDRKNKVEMTTDKILEEIEALNRFKRIRIDTFGFDAATGGGVPAGAGGGTRGRRGGGGMGGLGEFMQKLAEQNQGAYTGIP